MLIYEQEGMFGGMCLGRTYGLDEEAKVEVNSIRAFVSTMVPTYKSAE